MYCCIQAFLIIVITADQDKHSHITIFLNAKIAGQDLHSHSYTRELRETTDLVQDQDLS